MNRSADYYIEKLSLEKHIEGGAFRETYRSRHLLSSSALKKEYAGDRNASTLIYFLLKYGEFSAFHRIISDEIWHFYAGAPLHIYEINPLKELKVHILGNDLEAGTHFQIIIPGGSWFASRCETEESFSLCGCSVAPGFDFADFELAEKNRLQREYPEYQTLIGEMTY